VSASLPFPAPVRRTLAALLLAFAVTHGLYQLGRAYFHPKQGLDLAPAYLAGRMVREGSHAFYDDRTVGALGASLGMHGPEGSAAPVLNFIYPPWVAGVYAPLSVLPWNVARRVWFLVSFLCFSAALLSAVQAAIPPARRKWAAALALAAACFYFPFSYGLMTGQSNDLLLLLLMGALLLLVRGQPLLAGTILAPALLWKPFLAVIIAFLVLRREGKALAGLAVGAVALAALSISSGAGGWADWLRQISEHNALTAAEPRNHSLAAAIFAFGLPSTWILPATRALQGLAIAAAGLLLLPRARRGETRYALQFGGTLAAALLVTPKAWEHYGVFLLPAFAFAAALAIEEEVSVWWAALLGASFAVWGLFLQGRDEYQALADAGLAFLAPVKCAAAVALLLVSIRLVWKKSEPGSAVLTGVER
jgi:hypothetical protein